MISAKSCEKTLTASISLQEPANIRGISGFWILQLERDGRTAAETTIHKQPFVLSSFPMYRPLTRLPEVNEGAYAHQMLMGWSHCFF